MCPDFTHIRIVERSAAVGSQAREVMTLRVIGLEEIEKLW